MDFRSMPMNLSRNTPVSQNLLHEQLNATVLRGSPEVPSSPSKPNLPSRLMEKGRFLVRQIADMDKSAPKVWTAPIRAKNIDLLRGCPEMLESLRLQEALIRDEQNSRLDELELLKEGQATLTRDDLAVNHGAMAVEAGHLRAEQIELELKELLARKIALSEQRLEMMQSHLSSQEDMSLQGLEQQERLKQTQEALQLEKEQLLKAEKEDFLEAMKKEISLQEAHQTAKKEAERQFREELTRYKPEWLDATYEPEEPMPPWLPRDRYQKPWNDNASPWSKPWQSHLPPFERPQQRTPFARDPFWDAPKLSSRQISRSHPPPSEVDPFGLHADPGWYSYSKGKDLQPERLRAASNASDSSMPFDIRPSQPAPVLSNNLHPSHNNILHPRSISRSGAPLQQREPQSIREHASSLGPIARQAPISGLSDQDLAIIANDVIIRDMVLSKLSSVEQESLKLRLRSFSLNDLPSAGESSKNRENVEIASHRRERSTAPLGPQGADLAREQQHSSDLLVLMHNQTTSKPIRATLGVIQEETELHKEPQLAVSQAIVRAVTRAKGMNADALIDLKIEASCVVGRAVVF